MRSQPSKSRWRHHGLLVVAAVLFIPLTGCNNLQSFLQNGGISQLAPVMTAVTGNQTSGLGQTFGSQTIGGVQPSSGVNVFGGPGANTGGGGMPLSDAPGGFNTNANGVIDLPIMKQSSGGSESAIRGCGPTSLLMATRRGNPREIQGVLVETCERPGGLVAGRAVNWLQANGYPRSEHEFNWTVERLRSETMERQNPVVINFRNPRTGNGHIVVVVGVTDQGVHINDPGPGTKRVLSVQQFENQWAAKNEWAIPVRA